MAHKTMIKVISLILAELIVTNPALSEIATAQTSSLAPSYTPVEESSSSNTPQEPTIYYIGDVHTNPATQKEIFKQLTTLMQQDDIDFIGVEGAWNTFAFDSFYAIPDKKIREKLLSQYFSKGLISGVEYFCCTKNMPLYGLEEENLYRTNREQYTALAASAQQRKEYISTLKDLYAACSTHLYSTDGFFITHLFDQLYSDTI